VREEDLELLMSLTQTLTLTLSNVKVLNPNSNLERVQDKHS
jgi:hypothetical protein